MMVGIEPRTIPYDLQPVDSLVSENPESTVPNREGRFRQTCPLYVAEELGAGSTWDRFWPSVPAHLLVDTFSWEELVRIWHVSLVDSRLHDHIETKHPLLWKVSNSQWRYGFGRDYNLLASHLAGLKRLELPGFDLRLVWTTGCNMAERATQERALYLDAALGLLFYHGGRHVLTVGFALSYYGVLIAQVQLRQKKGNRFLYKLPAHYLDSVLDVFHVAFGDTLWLIEGRSAADSVRRSYGSGECGMTDEDEARISDLYSRSLAKFTRTTENIKCADGRRYDRLQRRDEQRGDES